MKPHVTTILTAFDVSLMAGNRQSNEVALMSATYFYNKAIMDVMDVETTNYEFSGLFNGKSTHLFLGGKNSYFSISMMGERSILVHIVSYDLLRLKCIQDGQR